MNMIFLVGMPAAGKTYWGNKLAQACDTSFIDLDRFILERERMTMVKMFSHGESWFRCKEHAALMSLIARNDGPTVVACGGGTPCFFNNMLQMLKSGTVVYLQAEISTIMSRLGTGEIRPLLQGQSNIELKLKQMLEQREPFYNRADYIFPVENTSLLTFDEIISECIEHH